MLNYNTLSIITDGKSHPELHCDIESGEEFFVAKRAEKCKRGYGCSVAYGASNYHIDCATYYIGTESSLCECEQGSPRFSFYFPKHLKNESGRPKCPWCQRNCRNQYGY